MCLFRVRNHVLDGRHRFIVLAGAVEFIHGFQVPLGDVNVQPRPVFRPRCIRPRYQILQVVLWSLTTQRCGQHEQGDCQRPAHIISSVQW
jgi:hypothetical protein